MASIHGVPTMTKDEFKAVRDVLGLSAEAFAAILGAGSGRTIRRWEAGERPVPGPVAVLCGLLIDMPAVRHRLGVKSEG
jgi:DNA-binding transcriptional regulator YiaG